MADLLKVRNLVTRFRLDKNSKKTASYITAVDDVSFTIRKGETLAIVGESGSGKSVTALSIMGLIPRPPGEICGGEIEFDGEDLLRKSAARMREIRGNRISMIFQEPMTSLNPVFTIGSQICEVLRLHLKMGKKAAREKTVEMLRLMDIPDPEKRLSNYPHQLSGGMRQRIMITMALCCNPELLIADEPTTALDVTIQAQILDLIKSLKESMNMSVLIITHDLGVVAEVAQRAVVMYAGSVMETGTVRELFADPRHPYTQGLLRAIPRLSTPPSETLYNIPGIVPDLSMLPEGCVFSTRCGLARDICRKKRPPLSDLGAGRSSRCFLCEAAHE
jgi:peptide/nickel transport system ATP-binding protein/oligopeptide transport system ATP-binding protein